MAACVALDPCPLGGAHLGHGPGYGDAPGSYSASEHSDGGADAGPDGPPSPQYTAYSSAWAQLEAQRGCWHDWQQDQSDMTDSGGAMTGQWSTSNSDGSWPSPPSAVSGADWLQMTACIFTEPFVGSATETGITDAAAAEPSGNTKDPRRGHPAGRSKRRFCTSYPDVRSCRRGPTCPNAHSREEICANLLEIDEESQVPSAMTNEFFMYKYKTRWCPKGVQHEWHTCVYAHNYQDARRPVGIGYGAKLCKYWSKKDTGSEYSQRCPHGLRCPYSHGAKEQLYHPQYFKTIACRDLRGNKACPRRALCAFYHNRAEKRVSPADAVDYTQPLPAEGLPADWVAEFLSPPFLPEGSSTRNGEEPLPYTPDMVQHCGMTGGMQMPYVFIMPVGGMMPSAAVQVFVPMDGGVSPINGVMS